MPVTSITSGLPAPPASSTGGAFTSQQGARIDDLEPVAIPTPNISTLLTPSTQDLVTLKSGRRIEGEITDEFGDRIIITLPSGSTVTIPKAQIETIDHAAE